MSLSSALLGLLAALLIAGMATDLRARIIPNALNLAIALLALAWWWAEGLSGREMLFQLALAGGVFVVFAGLFALGAMGGGDVKLLAAVALWLPPALLLPMLTWMAIGGGILTLVMLAQHRLRRRAGRPEVPYGVAIAGATMLVMANGILTNSPA
jgi:prepilin peptidase CpaA